MATPLAHIPVSCTRQIFMEISGDSNLLQSVKTSSTPDTHNTSNHHLQGTLVHICILINSRQRKMGEWIKQVDI